MEKLQWKMLPWKIELQWEKFELGNNKFPWKIASMEKASTKKCCFNQKHFYWEKLQMLQWEMLSWEKASIGKRFNRKCFHAIIATCEWMEGYIWLIHACVHLRSLTFSVLPAVMQFVIHTQNLMCDRHS